MNLLPADYALGGLAIALAVLGLFRGLSGTLAFLMATLAASATGTFGWRYSAAYLAVGWQRAGAVLVATLLAFGLVRVLVRKLVNGALAQPSDALFGCLVGLATGAAVVGAWGYLGLGLEYSALASEVARHVGP